MRSISNFRRHDAFASLREHLKTKPVLFHGSRYGNAILTSGWLLAPTMGDRCVSFSRNPAVALYMATLDREFDEGHGMVFVIDRMILLSRYRIYSRCNGFKYRDEAEEAVWQDVKLINGLVLETLVI